MGSAKERDIEDSSTSLSEEAPPLKKTTSKNVEKRRNLKKETKSYNMPKGCVETVPSLHLTDFTAAGNLDAKMTKCFGEANFMEMNPDTPFAGTQKLKPKGPMEQKSTETETTQTMNKSQDYFQLEAATETLMSIESMPYLEGTVAVTDFIVAADLQGLDDKIKSMVEDSEQIELKRGRRLRSCKVCGKTGTQGDVQRHIETNHIDGITHTCNICGHVLRTRIALFRHKQKKQHFF